jgi:hypothetical protein
MIKILFNSVTSNASVIEKTLAELVEEPNDIALADEEEDDTCIDNRYLANVGSSWKG